MVAPLRLPKTQPVSGARGPEACDDAKIAETFRLAEGLLPGRRMTAWQRSWCTRAEVGRFLRGRRGDPAAAAAILAQALRWREDNKEVLSGARQPRWCLDLRVLTCGSMGYPIAYNSFRSDLLDPSKTIKETIEHATAVMEAMHLEAKRNGVAQGDAVWDCHAFSLASWWNPAPLRALIKMAMQPYRDCLRTALIVDAPASFEAVWRVASSLLDEKTRSKMRFVSQEEAVRLIAATHGAKAAQKLDKVMQMNRQPEGCKDRKWPSEVEAESKQGSWPGSTAGQHGHVSLMAAAAHAAAGGNHERLTATRRTFRWGRRAQDQGCGQERWGGRGWGALLGLGLCQRRHSGR